MTIHFDALEPHIRLQILNKIAFLDYVHFSKSSRSSRTLSKSPIPRKTYEIENMEEKEGEILFWLINGQEKLTLANILETTPVRFSVTFIDIHLTEEICEKWIKLFETKVLVSRNLTIRHNHENSIDCSPENFDKFLIVSKTRRFTGPIEPDSEYFDQPALLALEDVLLSSIHKPIPTSKILSLNAHTMFVHCIASPGDVNQLFKEWANGTREIKFIGLEAGWPIEEDAVFLEELPYRTIWTREIGANEIIRPDQVEKLKATRIYALQLGEEKISVAIRDDNFCAHKLKPSQDFDQEFKTCVDDLDDAYNNFD